MLNSRFSLPVIVIAIMLILAACGPGNSSDTLNEECNKWGCVSIQIEQPVQWMKPAPIRLTAKSTQKTGDIFVSLTIYGMDRLETVKFPEHSEVNYKDNKLGLVWTIHDVEAGQEYVLEGQVILAEPSYKIEANSYNFYAVVSYRPNGHIRTGMNIMLDGNGNQLSPAQVKEYLETEVVILPIETGIIQFPTDTPAPTFPLPTGTPTRTATTTRADTLAPYP